MKILEQLVPSVCEDLFTERTYPVLAPTYTNEPSSSIASQIDISSNTVQVRHSTQPSRPPESDFPRYI